MTYKKIPHKLLMWINFPQFASKLNIWWQVVRGFYANKNKLEANCSICNYMLPIRHADGP